MRDMSVKYTLRDIDEELLKRITEEYKMQHNLDSTEDRMFDIIMNLGSWHNIDEKFRFHECKLGIIEDNK